MKFEVRTTPRFEKAVKALAKKYRSFKSDLSNLIDSLEENGLQGTEISPGIRKLRLAIISKKKGKSGGARVITYSIVLSEEEGRVYLIDVYDKSDFSSVDVNIIKKIIEDLSLGDFG
ncbi:MAG: addiction module toxin RelE [Muribaculaceae bacterium]|nr:addiction module toxin RelE [Muribaculaceae bacterium]